MARLVVYKHCCIVMCVYILAQLHHGKDSDGSFLLPSVQCYPQVCIVDLAIAVMTPFSDVQPATSLRIPFPSAQTKADGVSFPKTTQTPRTLT